VAFSPNGESVLSGGMDGFARVWGADDGTVIAALDHSAPVWGVAYAPDGSLAASGDANGTAIVWAVPDWTEQFRFEASVPNVPAPLSERPMNLVFAEVSGELILVVGVGKGGLEAWDVRSQEQLWQTDAHFQYSSAVSHDGATLLTGGFAGNVHAPNASVTFWDTRSGQQLRTYAEDSGNGAVWGVAFAPSADAFFTSGTTDNSIHLLPLDARSSAESAHVFRGHGAHVQDVKISPSGDVFASCSADNTARLWEIPEAYRGPPVPSSRVLVSVITDDVRIPLGDEFTIQVLVEDVENLAGFQTDVRFDPNVLDLVMVEEGELLAQDGAVTFFQPGDVDSDLGVVTDVAGTWVGFGGAAGSGTLFTAVFRAAHVGNSAIALDQMKLGDVAADSIAFTLRNASVQIRVFLPWDVNQDEVVDIFDLILVAQVFGEPVGADAGTDVNGDGVINIADLILIASHFGESGAAPFAAPQRPGMEHTALLQTWLAQARRVPDASTEFRHGVAVLERLLLTAMPQRTALLSPYPNPFNPETWIPFALAAPSQVSLSIYDMKGTRVRQINLGYREPGVYDVPAQAARWDGRNALGESVGSGVYIAELQAGGSRVYTRLLLAK
jgi:hypothetical protein